jgi:bacteriorhodopsin
METLNDIAPFLPSHLQQGDYVALTFFLTTVAMTAGAIFFFFQFLIVPSRWKNSTLIMAMILTIAALNYFYMRDYWVERQMSPTEFRYFDWLLTVPLLCAEFYLLISHLGVSRRKLWVMIIGSVWMLFWGYIGEAIDRDNAYLYGALSSLGIIVTLFEMGRGIRWASLQPDAQLKRGYIFLFVMTVICWNVYPIGYLTIPGLFLSGVIDPAYIDILYNLGDVVNKVVFSMALFLTIIYPSKSYQEKIYGRTSIPKLSFQAYRSNYEKQAILNQLADQEPAQQHAPKAEPAHALPAQRRKS